MKNNCGHRSLPRYKNRLRSPSNRRRREMEILHIANTALYVVEWTDYSTNSLSCIQAGSVTFPPLSSRPIFAGDWMNLQGYMDWKLRVPEKGNGHADWENFGTLCHLFTLYARKAHVWEWQKDTEIVRRLFLVKTG